MKDFQNLCNLEALDRQIIYFIKTDRMRKDLGRSKKQLDDCGICLSRKVSASIDCCVHEFCNTCIKDWVKKDTPNCPLCRGQVSILRSIRTGAILYRVRKHMIVAEEEQQQLPQLREQQLREYEPERRSNREYNRQRNRLEEQSLIESQLRSNSRRGARRNQQQNKQQDNYLGWGALTAFCPRLYKPKQLFIIKPKLPIEHLLIIPTMIKGELLAITYSSIIKQIYKLSKSSDQLNQRLQAIGHQIGLRVADQFNDRATSKLNPAENVKAYLKGIVKLFLGVQIQLTNQSIQFLKRQHLYDLQYTIKDNHFADFVLLPEKMFDSVEERQKFNYLAILTGFICGALSTMNFIPKVSVEKDNLQQVPESSKNVDHSMIFNKNQTIIRVKMQKQIKNDD